MGSVVGVQYVLPAQPVDGDVISSGAQIKGKKVKGQPLVLRKVQVGEHLQPAAEPAERRIAQVGVGTSKGDNPMYTSVLTMEEARQLTNERNTEVKASNPRQILADLKAGNNRFWTGKSEQENLSLVARSVLIDGQAPKVMVIGCADSRVPIEIILDQGLGDVFVCRNAGNLWGTTVAGTMDYAVNHLGIKLIIVLGHQGCGAVKASRLPVEAIMKEPPKLKEMLLSMKEGLAYCSDTLDNMQDANARDRESVIANAQAQVRKIMAAPNVGPKIASGEVLVMAAFYEITSGIVDFIERSPMGAPAAK